jgi:parallel beta-helix repeat protein
VELQTKHRVVPDAVEEKAESSESRFLNGRLGMFLNSRRGVPTYRTITSFDWDVAPLPRRRQRAGILHADAYCMPKATKNKPAAWAFIEFANSPDGQRSIATSGRTVPSLRALAESPAFLDPGARPRNSRAFIGEILFIRAVPVTEGWVDVEELAGEELGRAYYGRAGVDEVIATATRRAAPSSGRRRSRAAAVARPATRQRTWGSIAITGRAAAVVVTVVVLSLSMVPVVFALQCGGATPCLCGDTVTSDYTMTSDLGPCPRVPDGNDTVGLTLKPGVTLDCQGHTIAGPGDEQKDAFGIRVGNTATPTPDSHVVIRQCGVTAFWWGIYVQNARDVLVEDNHLHDNGWKVPVENGSGYGLDVANSQGVTVRGNLIADNGNEGFHLSGSSNVTVDGNVLVDNGFEQLYLIYADDNIIRNNRAEGGTQGLEMRYSNGNAFSYNVWARSPAQILENDNNGNTFYYDSFEGRVVVGAGSSGNVFRLSAFTNPTGTCLSVSVVNGTYVYKGRLSCARISPLPRRRSAGPPGEQSATVSKSVTLKFPGCTADIDLDANVGDADRQVILAAMGSVIGDPNWNPEADLDHDGDVDAADLPILESQLGPCAANLALTAVSNPPATAVPGTSFSVTDTVQNSSRFAAGLSRTQYYLSLDPLKDSGDKLLGGRGVPALAPNGLFTGTVSVLIPASTPVGTYFLLACADDIGAVAESDETDNCRASAATVQVGRPDLTLTSLSGPPPAVALGGSFPVRTPRSGQSARLTSLEVQLTILPSTA